MLKISIINLTHTMSFFFLLQKFVDEIKGVKKQIIDQHKVGGKKAVSGKEGERSVLDRFKAKKRT